MTFLEYKEYERSVAAFFEREGIENLSDKIECEEPYFSWRSCECCGRSLGGDRFDMSGVHKESGEVFDYAVCTDCRYYVTYGQLDDMTMMDMNKETAKQKAMDKINKNDDWGTEPARLRT